MDETIVTRITIKLVFIRHLQMKSRGAPRTAHLPLHSARVRKPSPIRLETEQAIRAGDVHLDQQLMKSYEPLEWRTRFQWIAQCSSDRLRSLYRDRERVCLANGS